MVRKTPNHYSGPNEASSVKSVVPTTKTTESDPELNPNFKKSRSDNMNKMQLFAAL